LLPFFSGIGNHALAVCLDLAERCGAFGGEIILQGFGRLRGSRYVWKRRAG
jgi:hypothetical protein